MPEPAIAPAASGLRVLFRGQEDGDLAYILNAWGRSWLDAPENRVMQAPRYWRMFQDLVVGGDGVLQRKGTQVLVGCPPDDRQTIWCYCVFTPGSSTEMPTIHWMSVKPFLHDLSGGRCSGRRQGLATRMLAAGGGLGPAVTDRLTYTCRPGKESSSKNTSATSAREIEAGLLSAARKAGITAAYYPLARWLGDNQ